MRYDPQHCSRKRLAHLTLRERPAPKPDPNACPFCAGMTAMDLRRPMRTQAMLDRRKARGDRMVANYERARGQHPSPYHFSIIMPRYSGRFGCAGCQAAQYK